MRSGKYEVGVMAVIAKQMEQTESLKHLSVYSGPEAKCGKGTEEWFGGGYLQHWESQSGRAELWIVNAGGDYVLTFDHIFWNITAARGRKSRYEVVDSRKRTQRLHPKLSNNDLSRYR